MKAECSNFKSDSYACDQNIVKTYENIPHLNDVSWTFVVHTLSFRRDDVYYRAHQNYMRFFFNPSNIELPVHTW